jgi:hypothetical protein
VITGGVMFSRYLGQSLGAAIFGAITNVVLLRWLSSPPPDLQGQVPSHVDSLSSSLVTAHPAPAVESYLRDALQASTHAVFVGLLVAAVLTAVLLLAFVPRKFPSYDQDLFEGLTPRASDPSSF